MSSSSSSELMEKDVEEAARKGTLTIFSSNKNQDQFLRKTAQNNNIIHIAAQNSRFAFIQGALNNFATTQSIARSLMCDKNCHGNTPLHIAAEHGHPDITELLYDWFLTQCGGDSSKVAEVPWRMQNLDGNTPAHIALHYGHVWAATYLVGKDATLASMINHSKDTLLHLVIQYHVSGDYDLQVPKTKRPSSSDKVYQPKEDLWPTIELLLNVNSSVTQLPDSDGETPLHLATSLQASYCVKVVNAMLASCPEAAKVINERTGDTVLHLLTQHQVPSYEEGLQLLDIPEVYALKDRKNKDGDTPLHLAARNHDTIMVRVLLRYSPKLGLVNKKGVSAGSLIRQPAEKATPMRHRRKVKNDENQAVIEGNISLFEEKLESIGTPLLFSQTPTGDNILHLLLWQHEEYDEDTTKKAEEFITKIIQMLPSLVSQQNNKGNTPLHTIADAVDSTELSKLVIKCFKKAQEEPGGGIHLPPWKLRNEKGDTPLHIAVMGKRYDTAIRLVKQDPDTAGYYLNNRKQSPLHLLCYHEDDADDKVVPDKEATDKEAAKKEAAEEEAGNKEVAAKIKKLTNLLINNNAEIAYLQDVDGLTPGVTAVRERNQRMIRILHGLYPTSLRFPDFKGRTLWHYFVARQVEENHISVDEFELMKKTVTNYLVPEFKDITEYSEENKNMRGLMEDEDDDGYTPLHLAIPNRQFGFAQFFLDNWTVEPEYKKNPTNKKKYEKLLSAENKVGITCYNLIGSAEHLPREFERSLFTNGKLLRGQRSLYGVPRGKIEDYANTIGVIAALLATITFTAAFTVPGGSGDNGVPHLVHRAIFQVFMVADVIGMCSSMMVLFCLLWIMTTSGKKESISLLDVSLFLLQTAFHSTFVTFMTGIYVTTKKDILAIAIATCIICTVLVVLMHKRLIMHTIVPFCETTIIGAEGVEILTATFWHFLDKMVKKMTKRGKDTIPEAPTPEKTEEDSASSGTSSDSSSDSSSDTSDEKTEGSVSSKTSKTSEK